VHDQGRVVSVAAGRLVRWADGFGERHGGAATVSRGAARDGDAVVLSAPDGSTATCVPVFALPADVLDVPGLVAWVAAPRRCAAVLVRRGGYTVAMVDTGRTGASAVLASKVGSRYVQSRTAAGGWSQQRFARRRDNQARDLARAVADVAVRLLTGHEGAVPAPDWLVTGGDRPLVDEVLGDPRLRAVAALPRGLHLTMGDPKGADVRDLASTVTQVRVQLMEVTPSS
jgi:hypothetical protein